MGVMNPGLVMRNIIPVVMAGVLGIYGLIVAVILSGSSEFARKEGEEEVLSPQQFLYVRDSSSVCAVQRAPPPGFVDPLQLYSISFHGSFGFSVFVGVRSASICVCVWGGGCTPSVPWLLALLSPSSCRIQEGSDI